MGAIVFESQLPVFLVIAVGLLLRKYAVVPQEHWRGIELLGYWLLFPVLLMESLIKMDLSNISLGAVSQAYLAAVVVQLTLVWSLRGFLRNKLGLSDRSFSSVFQTSTRWNGFIALAIANKMAGEQGLALVALIMAITVPVLNFVNIIVLTVCTSETRPTIKQTALNTAKVPLIWGALAGLAINLSGVPVYEPVMTSLGVIGSAGLGIGLLTVGAGIRVQAILSARTNVILSIVAKLFFFPLLVFIACRIFSVTGLPLQIAMLSASVSAAMNGYVLARQMGGDAELYASATSLQVIISLFSIPLIMWLVSLSTPGMLFQP